MFGNYKKNMIKSKIVIITLFFFIHSCDKTTPLYLSNKSDEIIKVYIHTRGIMYELNQNIKIDTIIDNREYFELDKNEVLNIGISNGEIENDILIDTLWILTKENKIQQYNGRKAVLNLLDGPFLTVK